MKILITTGIYPPAIGGPAKYAEKMKNEWEAMGHRVYMKTYGIEHHLPSIIRHLFYLIKIIPAVIMADFIFALDTSSVGIPATVASIIFGKEIIMRTGGDFLWENYVERTGDLVLLRNFYENNMISDRNYGKNWSKKEKKIFKLTKWALHHVSVLVFSTEWQRDIWMKPYELENVPIEIIENRYGEKKPFVKPIQRDFIAGTRLLRWKNKQILEESFNSMDIRRSGAVLNEKNYNHEDFMLRISEGYAVILVSLGDISPNMILDSICFDKPFIITRENGLMNRIKDIAIIVDPENIDDIREKIIWLSNEDNYYKQVERISKFTFTHSWTDIADEILNIHKSINNN